MATYSGRAASIEVLIRTVQPFRGIRIMNRRELRQASYTVIASLLSALVTLLGVLVTLYSSPSGRANAEILAYVVGAVVLIVLAFIYARDYLRELQEIHRQLAIDETLRKSVPTIVEF